MGNVPIAVASTKWDGSLHYEYDATLVAHEGPALHVAAPRGTETRSYRGPVRFREDTRFTFFTDRWYHVERVEPGPSHRWTTYVNVGTPATFEDGTIRWVDLDVDVLLLRDGTIVVDDLEEFAEHRERFAYPDHLVERVMRTQEELVRLGEARAYPFDAP